MALREILLVVLSAFLHALWNTTTKGSRSPVAFALWIAALTGGSALILLPFFDLADIPEHVWWILGVTGVLHALYFYWLAKGYESGDLSLVYPIARSTPAFVPLVAVPVLGEHLSLLGAVGIGTVVLGIWLVHAEGRRWRSLRTPAAVYALLTLATTVGYSLLDKEGMAALNKVDWSGPAPRAVVYFCIEEAIMFVLFLPLALREVGSKTVLRIGRSELGTWVFAAIASFASYALILEVFRTAPVSYVVAARQLSVLFAVGIAAVYLHERPSRMRLLGWAATVLGVGLVSTA